MIFGSTNQLFFPHITVWGSCFSLGSRRGSRLLRPPSLTSQSHHNSSQLHSSQLHSSLLLTPYFSHPHFSHLTHHILTSHTSLITAPLLTPHLSHHMPFSHLTWHSWPAAASRVAGAVHLSPHNSSQLHFSHLTYHISHLTPQLSHLTQHFSLTIVTAHVKHHYITSHISLITAARSRVAGAVHRASWWSCGARGRRWPAAAFCVANAVHRASWRSCGARGRRWPHSSQQKRKEFPGREQGADREQDQMAGDQNSSPLFTQLRLHVQIDCVHETLNGKMGASWDFFNSWNSDSSNRERWQTAPLLDRQSPQDSQNGKTFDASQSDDA